ncbi:MULTISPECIES: ATP-binding cassette domain-containing protein [Sphingobium]|jgi:molybdate transport system ATP-binding protein|uniref:ATP-binding cassette domain-containing protein n=1 Tax=Sphingobium TaxID=165695 RepID=UPI000E7735AD|nr:MULTISPECIES: ATP-binding cassette domain-containing protein [Sphingobium]KAA9014125.1 ATP-binding cassette domain-containing protein [Sphingobium limneticum]MBU0931194.1 ATP-binding cassette domain-containing protein [Alphaproteobacteria bacterium]
MSFDIDVSRTVGGRRIALTVRTDRPLVALVGPSGVGKTSILDMVAGIIRPDRGHIAVDGQTLFDSDAKIDMPPAERHAGYVFQDRRLFPHMRVRANLLYGRRTGISVDMDDVLDFLGIGHLLHRWPRNLSGGEAQRVAIGRALLSGPRFLLLDEPLSSLDRHRKSDILDAIDQIRMRAPILYVTHDIGEAERLSAMIVTMAGDD